VNNEHLAVSSRRPRRITMVGMAACWGNLRRASSAGMAFVGPSRRRPLFDRGGVSSKRSRHPALFPERRPCTRWPPMRWIDCGVRADMAHHRDVDTTTRRMVSAIVDAAFEI